LRLVLGALDGGTEIVVANSAAQGLAMAAQHADLSLVLLDLTLPGMHGSQALTHFVQRFPFLPVVILSASENHEDMQAALHAGAVGYISKASRREVMIQAIKLVLAGGIYLPPELLRGPAPQGVGAPATPEAREEMVSRLGLTPRQLDVLRYVIEGKSNKEISRALDIAEATTKTHVTAVFKALNVDNRTKAARVAARLGLIAPPD
jgi:DNA-binding NarL/FixJ family response regulator